MFPRWDVYALHGEIGGGQRHLVAGDGYLSYYAYDYDGNRAIKMTGNEHMKDYEIAILYFGARHYDSELLTANMAGNAGNPPTFAV